MPTKIDRNTSTGGVDSGDETPPSSSLELEDVFDVLTLAPSSSSPAAKSTNSMHFANATVISLSADEVAIVFSYLPPKEIMLARVCTAWKNAAKNTIVPLYDFGVNCMRSYNALRIMSTALPNLQQVSIRSLGQREKFADGENPDQILSAHTAHYTVHDLNIISNFRKLRVLEINDSTNINPPFLNGRYLVPFNFLNGRYPVLFNFPTLQRLKLWHCHNLKWDLDMLSGCPLLRELSLVGGDFTGDLKSLRVLKNTLETVFMTDCEEIDGNFMVLADFPHLKEFWICGCPLIGDIRDIQEEDFPSLEKLELPSTVIGGHCYRFQRISDVPSFMQAIHPLLKRFPETFIHEYGDLTDWKLSKGSADWYEASNSFYEPPLGIDCVLSEGLRCGWRWSSTTTRQKSACEVNWLDPEPSEDSDGYEKYVECMQRIDDETDFYRGYYEPPTEEEYSRLCMRERGE